LKLKLFCPFGRVLCSFHLDFTFFILSFSVYMYYEQRYPISLPIFLISCRYSPVLFRVSSPLCLATFYLPTRTASEDVLLLFLASLSPGSTPLHSFESFPPSSYLPFSVLVATTSKSVFALRFPSPILDGTLPSSFESPPSSFRTPSPSLFLLRAKTFFHSIYPSRFPTVLSRPLSNLLLPPPGHVLPSSFYSEKARSSVAPSLLCRAEESAFPRRSRSLLPPPLLPQQHDIPGDIRQSRRS